MTGISTLGQALRQIENIKNQQTNFATLSTQMTSGKKTQFYSGLSTDALTSMRARNQFSSLEVYTNNIKRADTTMNLMLTSIGEYQAQSKKFSGTLINFLQKGPHQNGTAILYDDPTTTDTVETDVVGYTSATPDNDFKSVIDHADNLYDFMISLLNSKDGDRYILGGADSETKPLTDTGTLDAAMNTLITGWKNGTITNDQLIADLKDRTATAGNPDALTDTTIGYSTALASGTSGDVFIRADENSEFKYTALANEQGFRDIMVALSFIKNENLPPIVDVYEDGVYPGVPDVNGAPGTTAAEMEDNFYTVFNEVVSMIDNALKGIDQVRFRLENTRVQMTETQKSHINQKNLMLSTISGVEDVDVNEVAVRLTTLQTQLESSYRITAISNQLSLVNYL